MSHGLSNALDGRNTTASPVSALQIREMIIEQSKRAGVGHIGSALCIADILATLYSGVLNIPSVNDPERDRFVLSKGHAALALYSALCIRGFISKEELNSFCADNSRLGVHPELVCPGIDFATGSLGQGMSFAAGAALAAKAQKSKRRVFVLTSDAECNEGSMWEGVMFAAHNKLSNLIAIIDLNGQQAFGYTKDVISMSPFADKWKAFGWNVIEVDGHNSLKLKAAFDSINIADEKPTVVIAKTIFGKGVSYMENQIKWHYSPLSEADYAEAKRQLQVQK